MGSPGDPKPAKYFVGLLSADIELLNSVETDLAAIFGAIDARSETLPWNLSKFYENEMGAGLLRRFVSFSDWIRREIWRTSSSKPMRWRISIDRADTQAHGEKSEH